MGLAASQARYLDLTARKSNIEFQGQMVNQQRTELANESAGIFAEMLTIDPPTAPTMAQFKSPAYNFDGVNPSSTNKFKLINWGDATSSGTYDVKIRYNTGRGTTDEPDYVTVDGVADLVFNEGKIKSIKAISLDMDATSPEYADIGIGVTHTTSVSSYTNEEKYDEAVQNYNYENAQYQKKMSELQARTQKIQVQDRTLELQLRQLDTEQEALQTELESVKKVIESSIDQIFKTFQS